MQLSISSTDIASILEMSRQSAWAMISKKNPELEKKYRAGFQIPPNIVRTILEERGVTFQKRCIAFQIIKGGTGKTTLAKNFGIRAASFGYKVLFCDFDHQANLTDGLNQYDPNVKSWIDIVTNNVDAKSCIIKINDNISLIPATIRDADVNIALQKSSRNLANVFSNIFKNLREDFDLIVCDCPPALGSHMTSVYLAADTIIAPINPDQYCLAALEKMYSTWDMIRNDFQKDTKIKILVNRFDGRIKTQVEAISKIFSMYSDMIYPTVIKASADLQNAVNTKTHVFSGKSAIADDLDIIVKQELNLAISIGVKNNAN